MKKAILLFIVMVLPLMAQNQVTVLEGETLSDVVNCGRGNWLSGVIVPQGLTDSLAFTVSFDNVTFYPLVNDSARYIIKIDSTKATAVQLKKDYFYSWRYVKLESWDAAFDTLTAYAIPFKRE